LKTYALAGLLTFVPLVVAPARAADNAGIERLATCQDSWFEWKSSDPARLQSFVNRFKADFSPVGNEGAFKPKSSLTVAGLPVTQIYPESVGMGVGFSVIVNAPFETTRAALEKRLGKSLSKCEPPSDNMRACGLEIGEKKTILLLAEDNPKATTTLIGCYYFYEK
jgi:hypothetical protein